MAVDPNDVRVLIPPTRRALEVPGSTTPVLTDNQVKALVADAIAQVIFFTGGLFGHELLVASRDTTYGAPSEWTIDPPLTEAEVVVVTTQAALNFFLIAMRETKTAETIRDEGAEWSYQQSANLLTKHLEYLQKLRDDALAMISAQQTVGVAFFSFLAERDRCVSQLVEPEAWGLLT